MQSGSEQVYTIVWGDDTTDTLNGTTASTGGGGSDLFVEHEYSVSGKYNVSVSVSNDLGSHSFEELVISQRILAPTLNFTLTPAVELGDEAELVVTLAKGTDAACLIEFGDGQSWNTTEGESALPPLARTEGSGENSTEVAEGTPESHSVFYNYSTASVFEVTVTCQNHVSGPVSKSLNVAVETAVSLAALQLPELLDGTQVACRLGWR